MDTPARTTKRRIGLMTGGGDCPGLNPVICAVVKRAESLGLEIVGIEDAFHGLLEPGPRHATRTLTSDDVAGLVCRGGTLLGTSNRSNPFKWATPDGEVDRSKEAVSKANSLGIEGLVTAGGDGSMLIARRLSALGLPVIGVPKTIDNDLAGTDQTFGFDTARAIATDAVDKLHTTAEAHDRVMVLEVMGRDAGFIALECGLAGGADVVLLPEIPYRIEPVVEAIRRRIERGRRFTICVVAEGAKPLGGAVSVEAGAEAIPGRGVVKLGGAGKVLADAIARHVELEVRVTVLGHLQRGGPPSAYDRLLGSRVGAKAAELAAAGTWNRCVVLKGTEIVDVAMTPEVTAARGVDPKGQLCELARGLGICLGE